MRATADSVTVSMSAPAHVLLGNHYDYAITFTYTGELTGPTSDYTDTDTLPAEIRNPVPSGSTSRSRASTAAS